MAATRNEEIDTGRIREDVSGANRTSAWEEEAEEHLLLCLSSAPSNEKVIRTAARMAEVFKGSLTAIYVEPPENRRESPERRQRLKENMKLAEDLGARIATMYGEDPALQIAEYVRAAGVTRIILGRTNTKKGLLFRKKNLVDRLMLVIPDINIFIIPDTNRPYWQKRSLLRDPIHFSVKDLMKVLLIEALATGVGYLFYHAGLGHENIITIYILGVLFAAIWTDGWIYGAFISLLSVVVFNFLYTEPRFSLFYYDASYPTTFLVMFTASLVTSSFTMKVKRQARKEAQKAYRTGILLETSHKLQKTETANAVMEAMAEQLRKLLGRSVFFYPAVPSAVASSASSPASSSSASPERPPQKKREELQLGEPRLFPVRREENMSGYVTAEGKLAAEWVYRNNKYAGATTETFSDSRCLYLAVRGTSRVLAVAGIVMEDTEGSERHELEAYEKNMMLAMLDECGIVLEKHILDEEKREAERKAEREALRSNLLRAISHDLRTPLTGIIGNAGILMERSKRLEEEKKQKIYVDIYDDANWLVNLVENLLSITRIENGTMDISAEPELIDEVFHEALAHLDRKAAEHEIRVCLEDDLLMAKMDVRLIVQVIINIVNNAIKYTEPGSHITLSAERRGGLLAVGIADDGPGIPDEAKKNLLEMFYTAERKRGDSRRGLGLGLALCKSIVTAHGGTLTVEDNVPRGTIFTFTLQIAEVSSYE